MVNVEQLGVGCQYFAMLWACSENCTRKSVQRSLKMFFVAQWGSLEWFTSADIHVINVVWSRPFADRALLR